MTSLKVRSIRPVKGLVATTLEDGRVSTTFVAKTLHDNTTIYNTPYIYRNIVDIGHEAESIILTSVYHILSDYTIPILSIDLTMFPMIDVIVDMRDQHIVMREIGGDNYEDISPIAELIREYDKYSMRCIEDCMSLSSKSNDNNEVLTVIVNRNIPRVITKYI